MLAMVVNDNALNQMPRGALGFFASMLAPTGDPGTAVKVRSALRPPRFAVDRGRPVNHDGPSRRPTEQCLRSGMPSPSEAPSGGAKPFASFLLGRHSGV
jgi:hypothetical protein